MTIHSDHPFLPPEGERDVVRQIRGRMPAPVTVWTAASEERRAGWTISSLLLAEGDPWRLVGLLDEEAELAGLLRETEVFVVNLLTAEHRYLADAFAGTVPAPGGPFTLASWTQSPWGPVLDGGAGWLGMRWTGRADALGWPLLVEAVVEHAHLDDGAQPAMMHLRGRYEQT